jgi:hypothetical protein
MRTHLRFGVYTIVGLSGDFFKMAVWPFTRAVCSVTSMYQLAIRKDDLPPIGPPAEEGPLSDKIARRSAA